MNNYCIVKITGFITRVIRKCHAHKLALYEIDYLDEDNILVKIELKDLKLMKKLNYYAKFKIVKYEGLNGFRKHLKSSLMTYFIILGCFALMDVLTSFIVKVEVIHENSGVRKLVSEELILHDIKKFSLAKDFEALEKIKEKILETNQSRLEWLSITRIGMIYEVRVEERIITDTSKEDGFANIISTKDALVTKIISNKGNVLVRSGDYVKKGDVLITGELKVYDEIKANTLATGEVYGDVWYQSDITFPLTYERRINTKKKRFNVMFNNNVLFKNKYQLFSQENLKKLSLFDIELSFYEEQEYKLEKGTYPLKEAEKLALVRIEQEFTEKLKGKGQVISKKVLKKEQINSTMKMSVFIITNELISTRSYYTPGSELEDAENSR